MKNCGKSKLKSVCEISAGQSAPQGNDKYSENGIPFIRAGNLEALTLRGNEGLCQKVSQAVAKEYKLKLYPKGTILFAKSGMSTRKGYVYVLKENAYVVSHLACIIPTDKIEPDFLKYYFLYNKPNRLVRDDSYPSISLLDISNITIPLPTLADQILIINIFKKIEKQIFNKKLQLEKLEQLAKSRFLEMFGRCSEDKFEWGLKTLEDCCVINPQKTTDSRLKPGLEVSFCPMPYVSEKGEIKTDDIIIYDKVKSGFTYFTENDVLFAKITPCMENGKGAIARNLKNGIGFGSTEFHVLRPKKEMITPEWLYFLTIFQQFRKDAENNMTGSAGQRRVPANFLKKYRVSVPPKSLQYEFARILQQLDKSKFRIKKSLEKLELTYKALLQEYFG